MKFSVLLIILCTTFPLFSQVKQTPYSTSELSPHWVQLLYQENPNLFELRSAFDAYYQTHAFVKNKDTQFFKRLLKENWKYVDVNGFIQRPLADSTAEANYLNLKMLHEFQKSSSSNWEEIGPWQYDHEQAMTFQIQSPGSAHVYTVEQSLLDEQLVYAGTATAGLWKSTNKGQVWTLVTKNLLVNAVYSIAIDPNDNNIVYFGEENGTIWKTIDGGSTWNKTGSVSFQNTLKWIRDLKIIGSDILLAATSGGLFRSTDGGVNWISVQAGEHMELEINPADQQIIYTVKLSASKTEFYKSIDNGQTWQIKTAGWPVPAAGDEQKRTEISVSEANPNVVYIWMAGVLGSNEGLYGTYKSTDAGESFTLLCCGGDPGTDNTVDDPNMLGYAEDGTENGGQFYYDLAHGVSPTDENRMFGSGINVWRTDDGGTNWELNAHWVTWVGTHTPYRYSHADVHDIKFFKHANSVDMWVCSDGGIFYSSNQGDTIVPRMHGIHGTDFWGYQSGFKQGDIMLGGTYHNGTLIKYNDIYHGGLTTPNSNGWLAEMGGDNIRGFVNFGQNNIAYTDNGALQFSPIRETRSSSLGFDGNNKCNTSYVTGEYGNYGFSPNNYNEFLSPVGSKLMKTTDGGLSFSLLHSFNTGTVIQVKIAWSNPNTIYVTYKPSSSVTNIMKSVDGGINWVNVTPSQSTTGNNSSRSKYIEVDEKDPNKIWCILIGSQVGNKVFKSLDGGATWTNITGTLINTENVISLVHHYGSDDGIYIGTTKAVYYRNNTMPDWALFNNNMPASTASSFLEPYYGAGKIRAASQRSVFECDFYEDVPPVAMPAANQRKLNLVSNCIADTVQFVDHSTVRAASATWNWTFEGGIPATSTLENPKVVYAAPGNYSVKLVVSDQFGSDSITIADFMEVTSSYVSPHISEDFENAFPPANWKLLDDPGSSWEQDWPEGDPSNKCASFPNYWVDGTNQNHYLILPAISLDDASNTSLSFDVAYNDNAGNFNDSLELIYRTGTNPNWQRIWVKGGSDLQVDGTAVWFWYDANPQLAWRTETVDLNFLNGTSCVELAFSNIGLYGNHIWLDNVNLDGDFLKLTEQTSNFVSVVPNPSSGKFELKTGEDIEVIQYEIYNALGQLLQTDHGKTIDLSNEKSGIYFLVIQGRTTVQTLKLIKK